MMIATSEYNNDDDGDGATGDKFNDDGDNATGDGTTGYNDNDDDGGGTTGDEVDDYGKGTMMTTAQRDATIKSPGHLRHANTVTC